MSGRILRIAHRGASAHAPENTLAAFVRAAELGADMVEMDLQASADGEVVVIHEADLRHTTNGRGMVYEHRLAELQALDAGAGERIPTVDEAIECCRSHGLGMYFELKMGFAASPIVERIRRHALYDDAIVSAFRPDWLADVRALDRRVATSVLFGSLHIDAVALARAADAQYVHPCWEHQAPEPHRLLTPQWIETVRSAGLRIIAWHEERPAEIAALMRLDVAGICSNNPERLLEG